MFEAKRRFIMARNTAVVLLASIVSLSPNSGLQPAAGSKYRQAISNFKIRYAVKDEPLLGAPSGLDRELCNYLARSTNRLPSSTLRTRWPALVLRGEAVPISWKSLSGDRAEKVVRAALESLPGAKNGGQPTAESLGSRAHAEISPIVDGKVLYRVTFPYATFGSLERRSSGPSDAEIGTVLIMSDANGNVSSENNAAFSQEIFRFKRKMFSLDYEDLSVHRIDVQYPAFSAVRVCSLVKG